MSHVAAAAAGPLPSSGEHVRSDGARVRSDGSHVRSDGVQVRSDGARVQSDGSHVRSDGAQVQSDGARVRSDGSHVRSDGAQVRSDGVRVRSDGTHVRSDEAQVQSDGTHVRSDGTHVRSDGAQVRSDGTLGRSDGARVRSDGAQVRSDGSHVRSDGVQVRSDGAQVRSDGAQVRSDGSHVRSDGVQVRSDGARVRSDGNLGRSDVSVTCGSSDLLVRVRSAFFGPGAGSGALTLGSCRSNGALRPDGDLLFTYALTQCGAALELLPDYLLYKFVLRYDPPPGHFPREVSPVTVNIECRYQRNHYLQKLAIKPTWETRVLYKRLRESQTNFQIQVMSDTWTNPVDSRVFQLGETVNFQVSAPDLPPGRRVYINSCSATPVTHSRSKVKYAIIDNHGCLMDSKSVPGASKFIARTDKSVRFSIKAFQFVTHPDSEFLTFRLPSRNHFQKKEKLVPGWESKRQELQSSVQMTNPETLSTMEDSWTNEGLHKLEGPINMSCQLHVTSADPSHAHKSCTYTRTGWEALSGDDATCTCCDSQCVTSKRQRGLMEGVASSRSLWVTHNSGSSSLRANTTGQDKLRGGARKAKNPKLKDKNRKRPADISNVEVDEGKTSGLEEFALHRHNREDESRDMRDGKQGNFPTEWLERLRLEAVFKGKDAVSVDPDGNEDVEIKQVLKQSNSDGKVKVLDRKDTTWYFSWQ